MPPSLNHEQQQALEALVRFAEGDVPVAILTGQAGTGKTTLLRALLARLPAARTVRLLAPTGRAARIVAKHTGREAATIHRYIYNLDRIVEEEAADGEAANLRFEFTSGFNLDPGDTLYVVDEASMLADRKQGSDLLRFGSGRLLTDLLAYVEAGDTDRQLLFVGDPYQLPPVGEDVSPALSIKYLSETFGLQPTVVELNEVVRQQAGSGIITHASRLRRRLETGRFAPFSLEEGPGVHALYRPELTEQYLDEVRQGGYDGVIAITYTNRAALKYNQALRARRYGSAGGEVQPGDRVIVVQNNYLYALFNGELGEVTGVGPVDREIGPPAQRLRFRHVELAVDGRSGDPVRALMLEDLLYSPRAGLTKEQYKLLWEDAGKRLHPRIQVAIEEVEVPDALGAYLARPEASAHQRALEEALHALIDRLGLSSDGLPRLASLARARRRRAKNPLRAPLRRLEQYAFRRMLREDPYYNALRLKFGYAITCHKAQGGEWDAAFVDVPAYSRMDDATLCRWTYTAVTRAARRLYVLRGY